MRVLRKKWLRLGLALTIIGVGMISTLGGLWFIRDHRVVRAAPITPPAITHLVPFNNEGISPDAQPTIGNFDGGGRSYSNDALTAAGFIPGQSVTVGGVSFQWVTPASGAPDNWQQTEQTIPLTTTATSIAFLGAATAGPSTGSGFVRYTDGSAQPFTLTFSDWTLDGGSAPLSAGNIIAVTTPYRNTPQGKETVSTYVFETSITLPSSGKTVASVTLPRLVDQGSLHVFAIAAGANTTSATVKGISNDSAPTQANLDGGGRSYSNNALNAAGLASGAITSIYGFTVQWPAVTPTGNDDWGTYGAVMPLNGSGTTLEIVGAAIGGAASGTATITYSDGTTQPFTLAFSDWTLGGGSQQVLSTNYIVATMPYRNTATGQEAVTTYLFATMVGIQAGKQLTSLTLPTQQSGGHLAVFAAGAGTASIPQNIAAISADATHTGDFDGGGRSYSNNALAAAGLASGARVNVDGFRFQWPTNAATGVSAWQSAGQVIPVYSTTGLGFLGAAANGAASGTATITYTDGTTQTFRLAFNDWTQGGGGRLILTSDSTVARMPYRNTPSGRENINTYVFFTSVTLAAGKTAQSVTLPSNVVGGSLDVFAVSGLPAQSTTASNTWPTYLGNLARTDYNAAETTITSANASQLKLKWTAHDPQAISVQPIVRNGVTYWGSWDGLMHATNATGTDLWTAPIGQQTVAACAPPTVGVASTATLGTLGTTPTLFVAGGNNTVYALNATTGQTEWSTTLATSTDYFIWDSPAVFNGSLYIGISSFGDCPRSFGKLYQLDLATGTIQNTLVLAPADCGGDGIWGSPAIDVTTGILYFATGNGCSSEPNSSAIEAVSSGDLSLIDRWQVPVAQLGDDSDFGNTPTLFTAVIGGVKHAMIGVANKNGYYYALDRTDLSAGLVWSDQIAVGGDCPDCGDGSISPSAFDGTTLYAAGGNTTINGATCTGSVSAINPANGTFAWQRCFTSGTILGAVFAAPGIIVADTQTSVNVLSASTGVTLFQYQDGSQSSYFYGAPTIAGGMLYAPNADGNLYVFGL